ncbi:hypothetical protein PSECIP111951_03965 [Pseudoalteromonas holothuriae]|uniref:Uncharacterized protein n=1 Tax=Pseudoalteromonas holothuriae TaxID=2963714 RepID=A0ABN8UW50_9GAMM|nr:hypothetical protein [Pseudoalteromonas sp. CIP111951]CAH9067994.1 hypothetical protein PSECIP111951_03965 [Pseudoalteromonas sp. CIP111951]
MNEILYALGWIFNIAAFLIVVFWVKKFTAMKWKLFFGVKKDLVSVQHHELYSCFLTAFCFLLFRILGSELEYFILSLDMEKIEKIKLFYTTNTVFLFMFIATLFCLHLVRGCTFSKAARVCVYTTLVFMMLQGMQLIARGYYDYHALGMVYVIGGWMCNLIALTYVASYPIKSLKDYFREKRAAQ